MRITALAIAVGLTTSVGTQRSDFNGTWQVTELDPPGVPVASAPVLGIRFALKIDGNRITVTQIARDELIGMELEVGGAPTRSRSPGLPCRGDSFPYWSASWEGDTLVLTHLGSEQAGGGSKGLSTGSLRLRIRGRDSMLVEREPAGGDAGRVTGSVYARVSVPLTSGLNLPAAVPKVSAKIADVAWIAGLWKGTTGRISSEEYWLAPRSGSMMGVARGFSGEVQQRHEFLCIAERDGGLFYYYAPNGQMTPTRYYLTSVSADSATFENPKAVNPTVIRYVRRPDGSLEITVEDAARKDMRRYLLLPEGR